VSLSYDGRKIVPAPLVTLTKTYLKSGDGARVGTRYQITLAGTLLPWRGSPFGSYGSLDAAFWTAAGEPPDETYTGNNEDFNRILRKQEAIRWLFSRDGKSLEWQAAGGQPVVKCNPRVVSVDFREGTGQWADRCYYTVVLEAEWVYINGTTSFEDALATDLVETAEDTWQLEEVEGHQGTVHTISHTVSAKGIKAYDETGTPYENKAAWEHAEDWVTPRIVGPDGDPAMAAEASTAAAKQGHYRISKGIDKQTGRYSITESWSLASPVGYYSEWAFAYNLNNTDDKVTVRFDGTIYGVAQSKRSGHGDHAELATAQVPGNGTARTQALDALGIFLGGKVLKSKPDEKVVNVDHTRGIVRFSFVWSANDADAADYESSLDVNHGWSIEGSKHTLSLRNSLVGDGGTPDEKITNARKGRLSDTTARDKAYTFAGQGTVSVLPGKKRFILIGRAETVNERQGTIEQSWNWEAVETGQLESDLFHDVSVQETFAVPVLAVIPIPGRSSGPIIQDMDTETPEYLTITYRIRGRKTKPSTSYVMGKVANHYPSGWGGSKQKLQQKSENWNPGTGTYELSLKWIKT